MEYALIFFVVIIGLVVIFGFINEKIIKIPNDIALLLLALIVGFAFWAFMKTGIINTNHYIVSTVQSFRFDKYLLEGVLCFMLFSGASHLKLQNLIHNLKPISLLALLTTVLTSAIYGGLFWLVSLLLGLNMDFLVCFILGCIVSPTDPIAATSILNKMGLSKDVTSIMEGESLFNDGTGVALFICLKDIYLETGGEGFFVVMFKELVGALAVGFIVSFLLFQLIKRTKDPIKHISVSLFAVSLCYVICEKAGFSGVIASVVCGIYFATAMEKYKQKNVGMDPEEYYHDFWAIMDSILNGMLYVMIGLSFIYVTAIDHLLLIALVAIIFNIVARFAGVYLSALITWKLPDGYRLFPFTALMTWGGLKGGVCLALALSCVDFISGGTYHTILYVTYVTIIFTTIVQGLSTGKLYGFLQKKFFAQEEKVGAEGEQIFENKMGVITEKAPVTDILRKEKVLRLLGKKVHVENAGDDPANHRPAPTVEISETSVSSDFDADGEIDINEVKSEAAPVEVSETSNSSDAE